MSSLTEKAPEQEVKSHISNLRRYCLLSLFCMAMFLDAYNLTAFITAISILEKRFNLDEDQGSWILSAFQLTYAAFLLVVSHCVVSNAKFTQ